MRRGRYCKGSGGGGKARVKGEGREGVSTRVGKGGQALYKEKREERGRRMKGANGE